MHTSYNLAEIKEFISFLTSSPSAASVPSSAPSAISSTSEKSEKDVLTYWFEPAVSEQTLHTFPSTKPAPNLACKHFTLSSLVAFLEQNDSNPYPLHVLLCTTKLRATRRYEDIESPLVFLLDLDSEYRTIEEINNFAAKYRAHLVVESSPGKFHVYWRVATGVSLEEFEDIQLTLAYLFSGDTQKASRTTSIRVPGAVRVTKQRLLFTPRIVYRSYSPGNANGFIAYNKREFANIIPDFESKIVAAKNARKEQYKVLREVSSNFDPKKLKTLSDKIGRNAALYALLRQELKNAPYTLSQEQLLKLARERNTFTPPLPEMEVLDIVRKLSRKFNDSRITQEASHLLAPLPAPYTEVLLTPAKPYDLIKGVNVSAVNPLAPLNTTGSVTVTQAELDALRAQIPDSSGQNQSIPTTIEGNARTLREAFSAEELYTFAMELRCAYASKNYTQVAIKLRDKFKTINNVTLNGPKVCIATESSWGASVYAPEDFLKTHINGYLMMFFNELLCYGKEHSVQELIEASVIKSGDFKGVSAALWDLLCITPPSPRQSSSLIVFQNGVFDTDTGEFHEDLKAPIKYTHPIHATYVDEARTLSASGLSTPMLDAYLNAWFPSDPVMRTWALTWLGYCMTTDFSRQCFAFFHGPTRAGKGSLSKVMRHIVGGNNYATLKYSDLKNDFNFALAADKLIISIEEVQGSEAEHDICMAQIKRLTGGERITINGKYQMPYEDYIVGKIIMESNEALQYQDKKHSVRARMVAVGFEQSFEAQAGPEPWKIILNEEADAIASEAARTWAKAKRSNLWNDTFRMPAKALSVGYERVTQELNPIEGIVHRYVDYDKEGFVPTTVLRELFTQYLAAKEVTTSKIPHVDDFARALGPLASQARKTINKNVIRGFSGVTLRKQAILDDLPELELGSVREAKNLLEYLGLTKSATSLL